MSQSGFFSKTLPAFGLDLSGNSFKLIQFEQKSHGVFKMSAYHNAALPKGMVVNDAITDQKTFDFMLKAALDKPQFGRLSGRYVVASLPESKSFVRVIQIPKMSEAEAESAVPYEAENFIPLPIDQVYLDWQPLAGGPPDKMNILMIASPKEFVDKYLEILDTAGLKPAALEVESQSCHRAVINPTLNETVLIVDLGESRSSLIMVEDGNLQFTSTVPIAGSAFTESIARALGVSSSKADEIKKKVGLNNTVEYPNIKTALLPVLNNLSAEVKNILKFHAEHSQKQVQKILLVGASARLKNLPEFLLPSLQEAGINSIEVANPWKNLPQIKDPPLDSTMSLGYITAIGLAARGALIV